MKYIFSGFDKGSKLQRLKKMIENGFKIDGLLVSYLNFQRSELGTLRDIKKLSPNTTIMLDSGAHSFLYAYHSQEDGEKDVGHSASQRCLEIIKNNKYDEFMKGLIDFVKEYQDVFDIYVELDIQTIVGIDKIKEWRNQWKEQGLEPMYVWHGESIREIREWVKDTKKIGIGGTATESDTGKRIVISKQVKDIDSNIWVHTFAIGGSQDIRKMHKICDSTDTTDWTMGSRFGLIYVIQGNDINSVKKEDRSEFMRMVSRYQMKLKQYGLNLQGIKSQKDWNEIDFMNLVVIQEFIKRLDNRQDVGTSGNNNLNTQNNTNKDGSLNLLKPDYEIPAKEDCIIYSKESNLENGDSNNNNYQKTEVIRERTVEQVYDSLGRNCTKVRMNAFKYGRFAKKLRGMTCNVCTYNEQCKSFMKDAVCAFEQEWLRKANSKNCRNTEEILKNIEEKIKDLEYRLERARSFEDMGGGFMDKSVTALEIDLAELYKMVNDIRNPQSLNYNKVTNITHNTLTINQMIEKGMEKYQKVMEAWKEYLEKKKKKQIEA